MTIYACPISVKFDIPYPPDPDCDCPFPPVDGGSDGDVTNKQFFMQLLNIMCNEYNGEIKDEC